MSHQEGTSPYNINTLSSRKVMRIRINIIRVLLNDPIPNSPDQHSNNCIAASNLKEINLNVILGAKGLREIIIYHNTPLQLGG